MKKIIDAFKEQYRENKKQFYLGLILSKLTVIGIFFIGDKYWWSWLFSIVVEVWWLWHFWNVEKNPAIALQSVVLIGMYLFNLIKWF